MHHQPDMCPDYSGGYRTHVRFAKRGPSRAAVLMLSTTATGLSMSHAALKSSGETSMRPIAKAAGGGQGTLYRHFPTREALPLEVYQDDFASVVDSVPALLQACQPAQAVRN